ncbi:hypothetical protein SLS58_002893 [Diplodia intermedia]|uniref:Heterokaryon incompatibility domain-containing protein n=1 Tax=Diplodia intermedia TaxID=856260 RepID=A0ABR3TYR1_9PEZI
MAGEIEKRVARQTCSLCSFVIRTCERAIQDAALEMDEIEVSLKTIGLFVIDSGADTPMNRIELMVEAWGDWESIEHPRDRDADFVIPFSVPVEDPASKYVSPLLGSRITSWETILANAPWSQGKQSDKATTKLSADFLNASRHVNTVHAAALPIVTARIDWGRVKGWIRHCRIYHLCEPQADLRFPADFRLVDTDQWCIVALRQPPRFVALSYVWGDPSRFADSMLTKRTVDAFKHPGALDTPSLPPTIRDAITACRSLEERYLWVDLLCIVQDSPEDKAQQIGAMTTIYTASAFVMVVAASRSMADRVPGISVDRPEQRHLGVHGVWLVQKDRDEFSMGIEQTKWFERGWTYQEWILPSRKLYLMAHEVWFQCQNLVIRENAFGEEWSEVEPNTSANLLAPPDMLFGDDGDSRWMKFSHHFNEYTRRNLTNRDDKLCAFEGRVFEPQQARNA